MNTKLLIPVLLSLALGVGLGCVPFLNEHLHWNVWFVLPISGLLLGAGLGWLQARLSYAMNLPLTGLHVALLALVAALGYAATDYGLYLTLTIPITDVVGVPDGNYPARDLITFREYMSMRLGSTSIGGARGSWSLEVGHVGTVASYIVDLIGAFGGAIGMLFAFAETHPFCHRCSLYKNRSAKHEITFARDEKLVEEIFGRIRALGESRIYKDLVGYLQDLSRTHHTVDGNVKIAADQRFCRLCREASIIGRVFVKNRPREWKEIDELKWVFTSEPGEHTEIER